MKTLALTNPFMQGQEVVHAQEELNKFLKSREPHLNIDGCFGPMSAHHAQLAKFYLGYPEKQLIQTYGPTLNDYLTHVHKVPAQFKVRAHHRKNAGDVVTRIRNKIVANARWGIMHKGEIHYEMLRPIDGLFHPYRLPIYTDCSGYVTLCYKWAGAPDPNGYNYNGQGNTSSLLNHMHTIYKEQLKPGDVIVYGRFPGIHTVIVIEPGNDPIVASNGTEADPSDMRSSVLARAISPEVTYLTLPRW